MRNRIFNTVYWSWKLIKNNTQFSGEHEMPKRNSIRRNGFSVSNKQIVCKNVWQHHKQMENQQIALPISGDVNSMQSHMNGQIKQCDEYLRI